MDIGRLFAMRCVLGGLSLTVLLLSSSCSKSAATSNSIEFFELTVKESAGIHHRIDTSKSELQVWHSDYPGGLIVVTRDDLAGQNIDYRKSILQVFAEQAKSIESGLEGEKFLGPAAYFKSTTLEHYGGSWRLPDGKIYSLTYTWIDGAVFRIYCQFPNAKDASAVVQSGRKALKETFGSIERRRNQNGAWMPPPHARGVEACVDTLHGSFVAMEG